MWTAVRLHKKKYGRTRRWFAGFARLMLVYYRPLDRSESGGMRVSTNEIAGLQDPISDIKELGAK
jgi:hypothetical protein